MEFENREAAHNWIIANQLGRRNLDGKQRSYLIGQRYQDKKKDDKENLKKPKRQTKTSGGHNDRPKKTDEIIAEEVGKSPKQVRRDSNFKDAVDAITENVGPETKNEILANKKLSKTKIVEIAKLPAEKQQAEFDRAMGRGEPSGGTSFDPSEWGGYDTVEEPVVASDVVTEHHLKEMQAPYREVQSLITKLKKAVDKLPEGGAGGWHDENRQQDIHTSLNNFKASVNIVKPAAICGWCGGKKCAHCRHTGVLNKHMAEMHEGGLAAIRGA